MKTATWKEEDRALSERAKAFSIAWDPKIQGTYNEGRNKAKRERRAMQFGSVWANPRAQVARPTKPVSTAGTISAESKRKRKNRKAGKVSEHTLRFRIS